VRGVVGQSGTRWRHAGDLREAETGPSECEWSRLNELQLGRYAEYFVKMEFTRLGFDVYTAEVDDKGIDFVVRGGVDRHFDVQVKSARNWGLITLPLRVFQPRRNFLAAVVVFVDHQSPELFLIPSMEWEQRPSDLLFHYRRRHEDPSKDFDEYQLRMGKAQRQKLRGLYAFALVAQALCGQ
jgi:hypothetical protein